MRRVPFSLAFGLAAAAVASAPPTAHARERGDPPEVAEDLSRKAAVGFTATIYPIGAVGFAYLYLTQSQRDRESCIDENEVVGVGQYGSRTFAIRDRDQAESTCRSTGGLSALLAYGTFMAVAPGLPRLLVGGHRGMLMWGGIIASSVVVAKVAAVLSPENEGVSMGYLGFVVPLVLGIIELSTTPRREDLLTRSPMKLDAAAVPTRHGLTLQVGGAF